MMQQKAMISRNCSLCNDNDAQLVKKEDRWNVVQCKRCGFVYVNPRPDEAYLKEHYQNYLPHDQHQIDGWERMMSGVFSTSLNIIDRAYPSRGRLLDIGCSHGFFLKMAEDSGWRASGIDLAKEAVAHATSKGLDVSVATLFEKKYEDEEFDVVTMLYVLEHLPEPMRYLNEIQRILKPGGILLARVPHTTPIVKTLSLLRIPNALYDAPSHLSDFSPITISKMLKKAGFKSIRTIVGGMTAPRPLPERSVSYFFGGLATFLYSVTSGKCLLPGVSKTTIAMKRRSRIM